MLVLDNEAVRLPGHPIYVYVNRGVGMSLVPVRIKCRPELTIFTLVPS